MSPQKARDFLVTLELPMLKDEFKQYLEGFWAWTSSQDRSAESWLYSLQDWAKMMQAHERQKDDKK
jgi:hypothetical protein